MAKAGVNTTIGGISGGRAPPWGRRMLEPYRVLDFTDERGELGPMLLGDLGADVVRVEPPGGIARPEADVRHMPEVAPPFELALSFLMNLLLIEFRAEIGFAGSQATFRAPELFLDRRPQAEEAAEIIERIRTDEKIHVESLRLYLGELRALTIKTEGGGTIAGAELIDRFWRGLLQWATVDQPRLAAERLHAAVAEQILAAADGARILREFDALADPGYAVARAA